MGVFGMSNGGQTGKNKQEELEVIVTPSSTETEDDLLSDSNFLEWIGDKGLDAESFKVIPYNEQIEYVLAFDLVDCDR